ncbi:hypothetical protein EZV62_024022 [Acer yangbiense]|uniref:F-box associated domain-containing protein n=1 Tax=Acer yangbiense TaxID=1000413 RepID=A0A5C7H3F9_9ROSI|nr:hypothetical protein EZV62_024022 [Acer yangbiense]
MFDLFSIDLETVSGKDDKFFLQSLEFLARNPYDAHCIICMGSCNGFLSVVDEYKHLFPYNPSIKECKCMSYYGINSDVAFMFGFGYTEFIDNYKIDENDVRENFKIGIAPNEAAYSVFGILEGFYKIVVFYLVEKKFKMLPPPDIVRKGLVFCDMKDGKLKNVKIRTLNMDNGIEWFMHFRGEWNWYDVNVYVYVESLISPTYKPDFTMESNL